MEIQNALLLITKVIDIDHREAIVQGWSTNTYTKSTMES